MHSTKDLSSQDLVIVDAKKFRDRDQAVTQVIMKRLGAVNKYEYKDEYQVSIAGTDALSTGEATLNDFMD